MRSRDEIERQIEGYGESVGVVMIELLLDIREMLYPLAHPVVTVEEGPSGMSFDELTQKYKDSCGTHPGITGVFRTPTGDIITTADTSPTGKYCDECGSYDHTTKEH